jgi:predicted TIM-barrel fold metal-dependent hydrolase
MSAHRIDVHHHIIPEEYVKRLASIGITESYGQPFPKWTPETSLDFMKKLNVQTGMMSISTPGVYFKNYKNHKFSEALARFCNEYMAEVKQKYPGRFGGFATIPLLDVEKSLEELKYSLNELKLDGVCLLTNYDGKYLGDGVFDKFFDELHRQKAVVYIHPTDPAGVYDPKLEIANSLIEAPFETTRAVTNLIYTGTTDRCPDIKYILSHGGGAIPYLAWRVALVKYTHKETRPSVLRSLYDFLIKGGPESGLKILKKMYYDTAITSSPYALKAMQEFVGPSQIVFGSDLPFSQKIAPMLAKDLRKYTGFSEEEFEAIDYKNCLALFPQLDDR